MYRPHFGIRGRILTIALVPSLALLAAGIASSGYLLAQGIHAKDWTSDIQQAGDGPGVELSKTLQLERLYTLTKIAGDQHNSIDLMGQRRRLDQIFQSAVTLPDPLRALDPAAMDRTEATLAPLAMRLPSVRQQVDTGTISAQDAYTFYSQMVGTGLSSMEVIARTAPDARSSVEESKVNGLYQAAEAMSRSAALSAAAVLHGGLSGAQLAEYSLEVGYYHTEIDNLTAELPARERAQLQALTASPAWQLLSTIEDIIIRRGNTAPDDYPPAWNMPAWQNAAIQVNGQLFNLAQAQQNSALVLAADTSQRIERNSVLAGIAVLLLSIAAFGIALWLSGRLIGRLKRLRGETLALADEQLPDIMGRLRVGEEVDLNTEVTQLDYGRDEIGQVAEAFNRAQHAALSAAVTEAKTRDGVQAIFLNIAHRSQVVVHRQLEILDKAEYDTDDPIQLDMLFRLDHLATRERRNAENLIILGGEQPGRRWRNPVPLVEIVRSAVAETEDYSRVRLTRFPELSVLGSVVADLIHLLAELVDNATLFSPPESRVEASGNIVGKGVVVEISDQGLGMTAAEIEQVNETLRNPPDFSVATLSSDSRLGMFVVALLAARNGTSVRLVESDYGGVRAIVLIPAALIAAETPPAETVVSDPAAQQHGRRVRLPGDEEPATEHSTVAAGPSEETATPPTPHEPDEPVAVNGADGRPSLPRRSRQTNLAPQLVLSVPPEINAEVPRQRSAEEARDLLSSIANGTRQGRHVQAAEHLSTMEDSNEGEEHSGPFQAG